MTVTGVSNLFYMIETGKSIDFLFSGHLIHAPTDFTGNIHDLYPAKTAVSLCSDIKYGKAGNNRYNDSV